MLIRYPHGGQRSPLLYFGAGKRVAKLALMRSQKLVDKLVRWSEQEKDILYSVIARYPPALRAEAIAKETYRPCIDVRLILETLEAHHRNITEAFPHAFEREEHHSKDPKALKLISGSRRLPREMPHQAIDPDFSSEDEDELKTMRVLYAVLERNNEEFIKEQEEWSLEDAKSVDKHMRQSAKELRTPYVEGYMEKFHLSKARKIVKIWRDADPDCQDDYERMVEQAVIADTTWVWLGRALKVFMHKVIFDAGLLALASQNPLRPGKIIIGEFDIRRAVRLHVSTRHWQHSRRRIGWLKRKLNERSQAKAESQESLTAKD